MPNFGIIALGAKPLQYFPKAPVKKGYVVLPQVVIDDAGMLNQWIARSISSVRG